MRKTATHSFQFASLALGVSSILGTMPGVASASFVECVSGDLHASCTVQLVEGVSLQTTVAELTESGTNSYQLSGDVHVVTPAISFPLTNVNLTVTTGDAPELYGDISLPLGSMPLLKDLGLSSSPSAKIGFVQGHNVRSFLEDDEAELPLNDGYSEGGTRRESNTPYFVFNFDSSMGFDVPTNKLFSEEDDQYAQNGSVLETLGLAGSMSFGMPGSFTATGILDVADPYFYLTYDSGGIDLKSMAEDLLASVEGGPKVYTVNDENGEQALVYTVDENNGSVTEQNLKTGETVYYHADDKGDYRQQGKRDNPVTLPREYFDKRAADKKRKNSDSADGGKKKRASAAEFIDAIGFSWHGWIPFKAPLPIDTGAEFDISGQLFVSGSIPLPYKAGEIDGDVVIYAGEYGVAMGGEGDVNLEIPYVPDFLGLSMKMGHATVGMKMTKDGQQLFIDGTLDPERNLLEYLPIHGSSNGKLTGYIGNDLENSHISIKSDFRMSTSKLGEHLGIGMADLTASSGEMSIGKDGLKLHATTSMQLIPELHTGGAMEMLFQLDWHNPEAFTVQMSGDVELLGIPLVDADIRIGADGLFINSEYVTPFVSMGMNGTITSHGPQLNGTGRLYIDLADITRKIQAAHQDVANAQAEVNRLDREISNMRRQVQYERDVAQRNLENAQRDVRNAQAEINSLDNLIAAEQRKINKRHSEIAWWKNWARQGAWWEIRDPRMWAEVSWRAADIAALEVGKNSLIAAKAVANEALNVAWRAVQTIRDGMDFTPIDLDPRVAGLISAKNIAWGTLEAARLVLKDFPQVEASVYADLDLSIGMHGLHGTVSAVVNGNRLYGRVVSSPVPQACITIGDLGEACARIDI